MLTTSPPYRLQHLGDGPLGQPEETGEVDADHHGVILGGVVGERLRDVDAGVVDQVVNAAEPLQCPADDPVGGGRVGDVAVDGEHVRVLGRPYRAGGSDHTPALPAVGRDQARADALGAAGNDGDLPARSAHGVPAGAVAGGWMIAGSLGCGDSGVVSTAIQGASGSDARIASIWAASRAWYRPSARPSGRAHSRSRCPCPARSCAACASRALVSCTVWPGVPGGTARLK